ncbi:MAG TPA: hypothetical protein VIZ32_16365 [Vicinamibacterales bacterium]|jgi:hypothetical protein
MSRLWIVALVLLAACRSTAPAEQPAEEQTGGYRISEAHVTPPRDFPDGVDVAFNVEYARPNPGNQLCEMRVLKDGNVVGESSFVGYVQEGPVTQYVDPGQFSDPSALEGDIGALEAEVVCRDFRD